LWLLVLKLNVKSYKLKWHFFQAKAEALFGVMEKTLSLLQKGFTEEEVSSAIDNCGKPRIKRCFKLCSMF
jgi:hypothetical protein